MFGTAGLQQLSLVRGLFSGGRKIPVNSAVVCQRSVAVLEKTEDPQGSSQGEPTTQTQRQTHRANVDVG